jgi:hypothetical protein
MPRPIWYKVNVQLWDVCSWGWWLRQRGGVCLISGEDPAGYGDFPRPCRRDEAATEDTRHEGKGRAMRVTQYITVCVRVYREREKEREREREKFIDNQEVIEGR